MLPSWASDAVTIIEPSWVTDRGKSVPDYGSPASQTVVRGCSVQPGAGVENTQARQNVIVRHTAYLPAGTSVTAHSKVRFNGVDYGVDGPPDVWQSPTGAVSHVVARLVDWKG